MIQEEADWSSDPGLVKVSDPSSRIFQSVTLKIKRPRSGVSDGAPWIWNDVVVSLPGLTSTSLRMGAMLNCGIWPGKRELSAASTALSLRMRNTGRPRVRYEGPVTSGV